MLLQHMLMLLVVFLAQVIHLLMEQFKLLPLVVEVELPVGTTQSFSIIMVVHLQELLELFMVLLMELELFLRFMELALLKIHYLLQNTLVLILQLLYLSIIMMDKLRILSKFLLKEVVIYLLLVQLEKSIITQVIVRQQIVATLVLL